MEFARLHRILRLALLDWLSKILLHKISKKFFFLFQHFDCAISEFQKRIKDTLAPLEDEIVNLTRSVQRHIAKSEEEFENIIDAAYPTCTEVHPYLAKAPNMEALKSK